jgi:YVTN family beta-propeller protein
MFAQQDQVELAILLHPVPSNAFETTRPILQSMRQQPNARIVVAPHSAAREDGNRRKIHDPKVAGGAAAHLYCAMHVRRFFYAAALVAAVGATAATTTLLPSGWRISPVQGSVVTTGTMPQGMALSPSGNDLAVVEAGYNPPALRILDAHDLQTKRLVPLKDAIGIPVWQDSVHVLVPGASTNTVWHVDVRDGSVTQTPAADWTIGVALDNRTIYSIGDDAPTHPAAVIVRDHIEYIANRGESSVTFVHGTQRIEIPVDLHPAALALSRDGTVLYVACADADTVDAIDTKTRTVRARIDVGLPQGAGASPNALALASDGMLYVSLGAENAVAGIQNGHVVARMPAGWYPDALAIHDDALYVANGKGESSRANPDFNPEKRGDPQYVAAAMVGSVRKVDVHEFGAQSTQDVLANIPSPQPTPPQTVVRAGGPIRHVIYIIKENRTYDQVLGDVAGADGDPQLAWFGQRNTPNEHAIVQRFGVFDDTYTDAQVSASGHNWSTAAFANDYVERLWPPNYGDRRKLYDFADPPASVPGTGYLWDNANRHDVSLRDYGEYTLEDSGTGVPETTPMQGLQSHVDPAYVGWNLDYSDELRVNEWQREFRAYVRQGTLPALEIMWLPNDHTMGTRPGALTPQAYVAQNDHAFGRIVDTVSHSPYWATTAIFAIEDDSQNGPDHVNDQRTTFYLASPYAKPGVHHEHYSTTSVIRTIELLLGMPPMTIYDATAPPMYDAFTLQPSLLPFDVLPEQIDTNARNASTAYGAQQSAHMNWSEPDANDPRIENEILTHAFARYAEQKHN